MTNLSVVVLLLAGFLLRQVLADNRNSSFNAPAPPSPLTSARIIGGIGLVGSPVISEFPHQLYLTLYDENTGVLSICGAVVYAPTWALTSASCVYPYQHRPDLVTVNSGYQVMGVPFDGREGSFRASHIRIHSTFDPVRYLSDIALIKINGTFRYSEYTQPIKISQKQKLQGARATATGYGSVHPNGSPVCDSERLLKVELQIQEGEECRGALNDFHYDKHTKICAGGPGKGICTGDVGGPLTLGQELVGIASYYVPDTECHTRPAAFTRVSFFTTWIEKIVSSYF